MHCTDNIRTTHAHAIVTGARRSAHGAPQALLDDYAELEQLIAEGKEIVSGGSRRWISRRHEQDAEEVALKLSRISTYGGLPAFITDYLQPALATFLDRFRDDLTTAHHFARQAQPSIDMLTEPDDVRAAIVRIHGAVQSYGELRRTWAVMYGEARSEPGRDPRGADSPLAEVRNLPDLVPHWQTAGSHGGRFGGTEWPWGSGAPLHIKLAWLLDHGADIWMPTVRQHAELWHRLTDQRQHAA